MLCLNILGETIRACTRACFGPNKSERRETKPLPYVDSLYARAALPPLPFFSSKPPTRRRIMAHHKKGPSERLDGPAPRSIAPGSSIYVMRCAPWLAVGCSFVPTLWADFLDQVDDHRCRQAVGSSCRH